MLNDFSALQINSNCDVSTIFNGGGPTNAGAGVSVGGKQLIPSPFVNLSLEKYKVGELTIGGILKLTLNGTVTGSSFNEVVSTGAGGVTGLKDILQIGQHRECVYVEVGCSNYIVKGYGRVTSVNINEGNNPTWVNMAPYTIEIDLYTNDLGLTDGIRPAFPGKVETTELDNLMLRSISESFSVSVSEDAFNFVEDNYPSASIMPDFSDFGGWGNRHVKVNFNINVAGIRTLKDCNPSGTEGTLKYGLEAAETYADLRINKLRTMDISGLFSSPKSGGELLTAFSQYRGGKTYLDFRTIEINPLEDSLSLSGEIIYRPSGCGAGTEDVFTSLNVEQSLDTEGSTITLSGNIQGLVDNSFDKVIKMSTTPKNWSITNCATPTKISYAEIFLAQFATKDNLKSIAQHYYNNKSYVDDPSNKGYLTDTCPFGSAGSGNPCTSGTPPTVQVCGDLSLINSQISRNLTQGEINFTFTLSNKPNCNIIGTQKLEVEIAHDKPHDNIVEILIPGRGNDGVITQNLCCKSVEKYDASINATINTGSCYPLPFSEKEELKTCAENYLKSVLDEIDPQIWTCYFLTNDQETETNNSVRISKTYVKPSC